MKKLTALLTITCCVLLTTGCFDQHEVVSLFPLKNYDQTLANWIKPTDPDLDKPVISKALQAQRLTTFYNRYFGTSSPWNSKYINKILSFPKPDDLKTLEKGVIYLFNNKNKSKTEIGYAENFRPYPASWINDISYNINLSQFENLIYNPANRAIAIDNLYARALPTDDVYFYHHTIAGQGYPFDNLQMSAVWVGSPLYILAETRDQAWSLVITQDFIAWVRSSGVARVSPEFIETWTKAAAKQFIAITKTKTSLKDKQNVFRSYAYVGSVFPGQKTTTGFNVMIPIASPQQTAVIAHANITDEDAAAMPLAATPRNFARIIKTLLGRPYGWGNMYFFNDCSAELKSLFTPFGIWLPRHSSDQVYVGKMQNLSSEKPAKRIRYLMEKGRRFSTLVYVDGHILLFIGNYPNPHDKEHDLMAMTFQNMWGLSPKPSIRRAVIGKSVLFPLLEHYPEDSSLRSQASKTYFQVSELDEPPNNLIKLQMLDLKALMYP